MLAFGLDFVFFFKAEHPSYSPKYNHRAEDTVES